MDKMLSSKVGFPAFDLDGNGSLDAKEWEVFRAMLASENGLLAIALGGQGDMTASAVKWRYLRPVPQVPSTLLYQGVLFMVNDSGILIAFDPATGNVLKQGRLKGAMDKLLRLARWCRRQGVSGEPGRHRFGRRRKRLLGDRRRQRPGRRNLRHAGHRRRSDLRADEEHALRLRRSRTVEAISSQLSALSFTSIDFRTPGTGRVGVRSCTACFRVGTRPDPRCKV